MRSFDYVEGIVACGSGYAFILRRRRESAAENKRRLCYGVAAFLHKSSVKTGRFRQAYPTYLSSLPWNLLADDSILAASAAALSRTFTTIAGFAAN